VTGGRNYKGEKVEKGKRDVRMMAREGNYDRHAVLKLRHANLPLRHYSFRMRDEAETQSGPAQQTNHDLLFTTLTARTCNFQSATCLIVLQFRCQWLLIYVNDTSNVMNRSTSLNE
jgi:hypothetical protein